MFLEVCVYFRRSVYTVPFLRFFLYILLGERRLLLRGVQEPWSEGLAAVQSRGPHRLGGQDTNHQDVRVKISMHTVLLYVTLSICGLPNSCDCWDSPETQIHVFPSV